MIKILYAAGNRIGSKIQLERFIESINFPVKLKIAAYKKSSPQFNIDWTLDCLLNIFNPDHYSLENDNFQIYLDQIKSFAPDLIISDLEYYTSIAANLLNIDLWQCSSSLLNFAMTHDQKYNLGLYKKHYFLFHRITLDNQRLFNLIDNSNRNFIYSHLGDTENPPKLKDNFEWIRPYHSVGTYSTLCKHNIVASILQNNKKILNILKHHKDSVAFIENENEEYNNVILKDIHNDQEYFCNIYNSNLFICEGETSFLSDAFYNGKFSIIFPNLNDKECVINSVYSEHLNISKNIYNNIDLQEYMNKQITINFNEDIKFLHERILET